MAYRLALDVGTASCGLIAWSLDTKGEPDKLTYSSLDIWPEPLLPAKSGGVGQPKKAARRLARQLRRRICRRARRLRRIAHLAPLLGIDASSVAPDSGEHIHELRAMAATEQVDVNDLLRIFLHMTKHRGPDGDWVYANDAVSGNAHGGKKQKGVALVKDNAKQQEQKTIAGGVRKLERMMEEAAQSQGVESLTLGEYLHFRRQRGECVVLGRRDIGLYPSRRMVAQEFDRIWDTQSRFHAMLRDAEKRRVFREAIFSQRPLKSPAPMVGRRPLEPTLPRAPAAQMASQEFRIEKQITDLQWGMGRQVLPLSVEQKDVVRGLLRNYGEVSFTTIHKVLEQAGCPGPSGRGLNMERPSRETLKGNTTLAAFRKLDLEAEWKALDEKTRIRVINFLADLGSPDALDRDDWDEHFVTTRRDPKTHRYRKRTFAPEMVAFINRLRSHPKFGRLSGMGFDGGRMRYSVKALTKLTARMQKGLDEYQAIQEVYPGHFERSEIARELPVPTPTGNTVVDVAMRQVYRAVSRAIEHMAGPPAEVIIELSRDMARGLKQRAEAEARIAHNLKVRKAAKQAIEEHGVLGTERNVDRYLLWERQQHYCPYCDHRIELGEALSGADTNFEHILPRSLTRVGSKGSQLVLAHRSCNSEKGRRTPWQAFHADESRWNIVKERAEQLTRNHQPGKARLLLLEGWEPELLDDAAIQGFSDRQFHEGSWIAKHTAQWLRTICADVSVSRGEMTAYLRRIWKLDTVIPEVRYQSGLPVLDRDGGFISQQEFERHRSWWEGHDEAAGAVPTDRKPDKRIDHRHHLVDALVISLTDRKLFKKMADNYKQESERARRGEQAKLTRYVEPPVADLRVMTLDLVKRTMPTHRKDHHPDGPFFEQMAYGVSRKPGRNGKYLLAKSEPLTGLIANNNAAKTRKTLERIESPVTREVVLRAFDERLTSGVPVGNVFNEPVNHPQYGQPIRRVRLLGDSVDTSAEVTHPNHHNQRKLKHSKRYVHAGNAYLEVAMRDGKLTKRIVKNVDAMAEKGSRPPSGVMRFWKGDTVKLPNGSLHLVGMIREAADGQLCLVPVTETCVFNDLRRKRGLPMRTVSGRSLAELEITPAHV